MRNSHRIDILYEDSQNRFGAKRTDSLHSRSPLPAHERRQGRWNSDPYDVTDGGSGTSEMDPGAWLLPYWMARYYGAISASD